MPTAREHQIVWPEAKIGLPRDRWVIRRDCREYELHWDTLKKTRACPEV